MYIPRALFPYVAAYQNGLRERIDFSPASRFSIPQARLLFICFTNRSGSTYLGELIASSNRINMAQELFNPDALAALSPGMHIGDYLGQIVAAGARHGWFAVKASVTQLAALATAGVLETVIDRSHVLYTERLDKVSQSISWQIAVQNKAFTSYHRANDVELAYDWEQIKRGVDEIIRTNGLTHDFLSLNGIAPFGVVYERMVQNPRDTGKALGQWLGLDDFQCEPEAVRLKEQRNHINAAWKSRFIAHCQTKFAPHVASVAGWPRILS